MPHPITPYIVRTTTTSAEGEKGNVNTSSSTPNKLSSLNTISNMKLGKESRPANQIDPQVLRAATATVILTDTDEEEETPEDGAAVEFEEDVEDMKFVSQCPGIPIMSSYHVDQEDEEQEEQEQQEEEQEDEEEEEEEEDSDDEGPEVSTIIKESMTFDKDVVDDDKKDEDSEQVKDIHRRYYGYSSSDAPEVEKFLHTREADEGEDQNMSFSELARYKFKPVPVLHPLHELLISSAMDSVIDPSSDYDASEDIYTGTTDSKQNEEEKTTRRTDLDKIRYEQFKANVKRLEAQHVKRMTQLRQQYKQSIGSTLGPPHHHMGYSEHICEGDTDVDSSTKEVEEEEEEDIIDEDSIESNWDDRKRPRYTSLLNFMENTDDKSPTDQEQDSAKRLRRDASGIRNKTVDLNSNTNMGLMKAGLVGLSVGVVGTFMGLWTLGKKYGGKEQ